MKPKHLFKLLFVAIISIVLLAACGSDDDSSSGSGENVLDSIKESNTMVFGVKNDTRLFGLKNPSTGDIEGFDIDIANEIAKGILGDDATVEFKEVTSKTRIPLLQNGEIDAIIATMTITDERKEQVDFSDVYFEAGQSLLVPKGSSIQSIDDITSNTKVLAVKGSTSADNIRELTDAQVLEFENYSEAFTALKAGQGDVLTTDNSILYGMAVEDPDYEVVGGTFTDEPYGIAVKKGQTELLDEINRVLAEIQENGTYAEVYNKWFGDME